MNETLEEQHNQQQASAGCFTPLQSRKLPQSTLIPCTRNLASLCSSMDLIALGLKSSSSQKKSNTLSSSTPNKQMMYAADSIVVHRILSWQKLMNVNSTELISTQSSLENKVSTAPVNHSAENEESPIGATSLCWSPDGRALAIGLADGGVLIYVVEDGGGSRIVHSIAPTMTYLETAHTQAIMNLSSNSKQNSPKRSKSTLQPQPILFSPPLTRSKAAKKRATSQKSQTVETMELLTPVSAHPPKLKVDTNADPALEDIIQQHSPSIAAMTWARFAVHPEHEFMDDHWLDNDYAMKIRARYLDRANHFLHDTTSLSTTSDDIKTPENEVSLKDGSSNHDFNPISSILHPSSTTPLSLLATLNHNGYLCLYLHGRYQIAQIATNLFTKKEAATSPQTSSKLIPRSSSTEIICSSDLSSIFISTYTTTSQQKKPSPLLQLHSIPDMYLRRHELQQIAPSYCFIKQQMNIISQGMKEAASKWKESLRPLDMKLKNLRKLLQDYGVTQASFSTSKPNPASPKSEILSMIFEGNRNHYCYSNQSNGSADAMIQFFSTHLNEQGFNRMSNACELGVASVEAMIRKSILKPARALVYVSSELYGLANSNEHDEDLSNHNDSFFLKEDESDQDFSIQKSLLSSQNALDLQKRSEQLYLITEQALAQIIECRHRLRDFLRWVLGTLTKVKAQGTAMDSFERKKARKTRPSQATVNHVTSFLSARQNAELVCQYEKRDTHVGAEGGISESEDILGIAIWDYFERETVIICQKQREDEFKVDDPWHDMQGFRIVTTPSLKNIFSSVEGLVARLLSQPCKEVSRSTKRRDFTFLQDSKQEKGGSSNSYTPFISIHKRVGLLYDDSKGGFKPNFANEDSIDDMDELRNHQWMLVAKSDETNQGRSIIQLIYIPCMKYDENFVDMVAIPEFYLEGFIRLPTNCSLKEISFYGDDGNSSLVGHSDYENNLASIEGRQAMNLLVERGLQDGEKYALSEELWMVKYDQILLNVKKFPESDNLEIHIDGDIPVDDNYFADILDPLSDNGATIDDVNGTIQIQGRARQFRRMNSLRTQKISDEYVPCRLISNGSRGTGGVLTNGCILGLFDLEEDDEEEEDNDDDSDDDKESLEENETDEE